MEMLSDMARRRGRAVVIVTHDNRTIDFADRIVHIEDGRLREQTPAALVAGQFLARDCATI
jgi:putative ABC transport system ATP-binding protein